MRRDDVVQSLALSILLCAAARSPWAQGMEDIRIPRWGGREPTAAVPGSQAFLKGAPPLRRDLLSYTDSDSRLAAVTSAVLATAEALGISQSPGQPADQPPGASSRRGLQPSAARPRQQVSDSPHYQPPADPAVPAGRPGWIRRILQRLRRWAIPEIIAKRAR